jgi:hypothetical protein
MQRPSFFSFPPGIEAGTAAMSVSADKNITQRISNNDTRRGNTFQI